MQIGSEEHKAQYFQDLLKQMRENIYFGEFQMWTIQKAVEKLQADKKELEATIEGKQYPAAVEKKGLKSLNEGIASLLIQQAQLEDQNKTLETRIIDVNEYVQGWKTA